MRIFWKKEENWPTLNKYTEIRRNPVANQVCDEYPVPRMTVTNCLQSIGSKSITFENDSPPGKQALISHNQVKYVEYIIVTRDTAKPGMSRREAIQTISYIRQASSYVQAENHLD